MSLKETATETLRIFDAGYFIAPDGRRIDVQPAVAADNGHRTVC